MLVYTTEKGVFHLNNMAVTAFTRPGRIDRIWPAQVLILRGKIKAAGSEEFRDINPRDARNVADFFTCPGGGFSDWLDGQRVIGGVINCKASIRATA